MSGTALVTGATGFIGRALIPALLDDGWNVRLLVRDRSRLSSDVISRVDIIEGDAWSPDDVGEALDQVDVAYYLLHSMAAGADFATQDRELAQRFAHAAKEAGVSRIVYLSGLHPNDQQLSEHLASRVEVGDILLASGVPTAVLQAGVVLGRDSASFQMLRHLTERLPAAFGPRWLNSRIQPIALADVIFYLVKAAYLPADVNRTIDIGMPETMTYSDMMRRYAQVAGLARRRVGTVPVLTPRIASHWVGFITPVSSKVAKPLVGSLIHDAVCHESDAPTLLGTPSEGLTDFDQAVRHANQADDPKLWGQTLSKVSAAVLACALAGGILTTPNSSWYQALRKPRWQPPAQAFPIVWTPLFTGIAIASSAHLHELTEQGKTQEATAFKRALTGNLLLNAGWSGLFFRTHNLPLATIGAAALAASSWDLARRSRSTGRGKAATLGTYAAWTTFATALTASVAALNPVRKLDGQRGDQTART